MRFHHSPRRLQWSTPRFGSLGGQVLQRNIERSFKSLYAKRDSNFFTRPFGEHRLTKILPPATVSPVEDQEGGDNNTGDPEGSEATAVRDLFGVGNGSGQSRHH